MRRSPSGPDPCTNGALYCLVCVLGQEDLELQCARKLLLGMPPNLQACRGMIGGNLMGPEPVGRP